MTAVDGTSDDRRSRPRGGGGGRLGGVLARPLFWVVALAVLFGVPVARSVLRRLPPPPPVLGTVPAFTMTDQRGLPFGTRELAGKVWIANFIFTSCQTMCPVLTQKLAAVGKRARHLGPDLHLVSFTVDPERDTPERLADYGARAGADPHKWAFLTGSLAAIEQAVVDSFKIAIERRRTVDGLWEIVHGEHLVLVDRSLRIRGYFDASPEGMDRLVDAVGRVANEPPSDPAR
jgi:protein SCO1